MEELRQIVKLLQNEGVSDATFELLQAIRRLQEYGVSETTFKLLAAIAKSPMDTPEIIEEFTKTGFRIATELYDESPQRLMLEQPETDPNNPGNLTKAGNLTKMTRIFNK